MQYIITIDDKYAPAISRLAADASITPEEYLRDQIVYVVTPMANQLAAEVDAAKLAAFEAAADTDTKATILAAADKAAVSPEPVPPVPVTPTP